MTTDRGNLLFIRLKSDSKETDSKKFYITEQDATDIGSDWNKTVKITYYPSTNRIQSIKVVK